MPYTPVNKPVYVIGHRNPDTDSICAAITYANLKNKLDGENYLPARAGDINRETQFALNYFGIDVPRLLTDVSPQVGDIDIRTEAPIDNQTSLQKAWTLMRDRKIDTLVITNKNREVEGVVTIKDIATANMDVFDRRVLAKSHTTYRNIAETLDGTLENGNPDEVVTGGKLFVNTASTESLEGYIEPGDIVLLSNRLESQFYAIELGASLIVLCAGATVPKTILKFAQEKNVGIIRTPHDTYEASRLISQSAPVGHYMTTQNLLTFNVHSAVENASKIMAQVRLRYFPILDKDGKYVGVISRRNLLNLHPKQLILVDHNEKTQAVEGFEKAEILEIIDHHRLGNLETSGPVYFRNQPVGCTNTIIYSMYQENGIEISREMAGLMLSAILSDTLMFRSPTCTPMDINVAQALAEIAQVNIEEYADRMFEAGGDMTGRTPREVLQQDFKIFTAGELRFGVGQGTYMTKLNREAAQALLKDYLPTALAKQNIPMVFYMSTDVRNEITYLMMAGEEAEEIVKEAFGVEAEDGIAVLPGVLSRKKQMIPALLKALGH